MSIRNLVIESVQVLRRHEPPEGYFGCFSGGKDSVLLYNMAELAGVKVNWFYQYTTIDPPEVVGFIKKEYPEVTWQRSKFGPLLKRVVEKRSLPTRRQRWCCDEYKEVAVPEGQTILIGVRAEESPARKKRWSHHGWHSKQKRWVVSPIYNWASDELWTYLNGEGIGTCSLYREGFHRIGCINCPLASSGYRYMQLRRWPNYAKAWRRTSQRLWEKHAGTINSFGAEWAPSRVFKNEPEYWEWWMSNRQWPLIMGFNRKQVGDCADAPGAKGDQRHPFASLGL